MNYSCVTPCAPARRCSWHLCSSNKECYSFSHDAILPLPGSSCHLITPLSRPTRRVRDTTDASGTARSWALWPSSTSSIWRWSSRFVVHPATVPWHTCRCSPDFQVNATASPILMLQSLSRWISRLLFTTIPVVYLGAVVRSHRRR